MCIALLDVPGIGIMPCQTCWQCRANRVNDLVGRCLAEQTTSTVSLALTLTYGGDTMNSVVLTYRDVQLMLKSLRNDGYSVRYIVVGEYGTLKGRAHWHIILFFKGKAPEMQMERRISWEYWPHGHVYAQTPDYGGFKYLLKYVLKSQNAGTNQKELRMSKKPVLGHDYLMLQAEEMARKGAPMLDAAYRIPGQTEWDKEQNRYVRRKFYAQGRALEIYLQAYVDFFCDFHGKEPPDTDFLTEKHFDRLAREDMQAEEDTDFAEYLVRKREKKWVHERERKLYMETLTNAPKYPPGFRRIGEWRLTEWNLYAFALRDGSVSIFSLVDDRQWHLGAENERKERPGKTDGLPPQALREINRLARLRFQTREEYREKVRSERLTSALTHSARSLSVPGGQSSQKQNCRVLRPEHRCGFAHCLVCNP